MKRISVQIKGVSALLMNRFPLVPIEGASKMKPEEQAENAAYRNADKKLYVPGTNVQRALVAAAAFSKGKGRASLQKIAAACLFVVESDLVLPPKEYVVDSRAVVIAATKGRIVRHRPRIDEWAVTFHIDYDETEISEKQLREIVDNCGSRVGLLDFRPACKGPFGRFMVTEWKEAK